MLESDDRRVACLDICEVKTSDKASIQGLARAMKNPEVTKTFMTYLRDVYDEHFGPPDIPVTETISSLMIIFAQKKWLTALPKIKVEKLLDKVNFEK